MHYRWQFRGFPRGAKPSVHDAYNCEVHVISVLRLRCVCVCLCVCVRERERERVCAAYASAGVCVRVHLSLSPSRSLHLHFSHPPPPPSPPTILLRLYHVYLSRVICVYHCAYIYIWGGGWQGGGGRRGVCLPHARFKRKKTPQNICLISQVIVSVSRPSAEWPWGQEGGRGGAGTGGGGGGAEGGVPASRTWKGKKTHRTSASFHRSSCPFLAPLRVTVGTGRGKGGGWQGGGGLAGGGGGRRGVCLPHAREKEKKHPQNICLISQVIVSVSRPAAEWPWGQEGGRGGHSPLLSPPFPPSCPHGHSVTASHRP